MHFGTREKGDTVKETARSTSALHRLQILLVVPFVLALAACNAADPTSSDEYGALEQELATATAQLAESETELAQVTAERDALASEKAHQIARSETTASNVERVAEIVDDPDAFGSREEVLDQLMTMVASPDVVMDDTAFGPVPMRQAWSSTLWGRDATIKTWVRWACADGTQAGSLWTWVGESINGEPFELIGINLDDYNEEGKVTYSLVDWPYEAAYVREAAATGNISDD